jgi:hypothetical protein
MQGQSPPPEPSSTVDNATTGAADPRLAVRAFLDAGKAQDLQAMSLVWGSVNGPARNTIPRDDLEKREIVLMCFLRHESDSIGTQSGVAGGKLSFPVVMTRANITRATAATVVLGANNRYYVETIELRPIEAFCQHQRGESAPASAAH